MNLTVQTVILMCTPDHVDQTNTGVINHVDQSVSFVGQSLCLFGSQDVGQDGCCDNGLFIKP